MKKHTHLILTLFLVLAMMATSAAAQTAPMTQGDQEIILRGTSEIKKSLDQIKADAEETMPRLRKVKKEMDDYAARSKDNSLDEEERRNLNARALEARARLHMDFKEIVQTNQKRFSQIDAELKQVVDAARKLDSGSEESRAAMDAIEKMTLEAMEREKQLSDMIAGTPSGTVSDEAWNEFEFSARMAGNSMKAVEASRDGLQARDYSSRFEQLRQRVAQRRQQLFLTGKIIDGNLERIRMTTVNNMTVLAIRNIDNAFASIATLDDPLGLDLLEPGYESQLLLDPGPGLGGEDRVRGGTNRRLRTTADFR